MADINKMSLDKIYNEMQKLKIFPNDLINITTSFHDYVELAEYYKKDEDTWEFIKKHEKFIDKEKLVFLLTYASRMYIILSENLVDSNKWKLEAAYENGLKLLNGKKRSFSILSYSDGIGSIDFVGTVNDLKSDNSKKNKSLEELNQMAFQGIDKYSIIFGFIDEFSPCVCNSRENAEMFTRVLRQNCKNQIKKFEEDGGEENEDFYVELYSRYIMDYLIRFPKEFNMEKIMLLSAWRMKNAMEDEPDKLDEEEKEIIVKCLKYYKDNIKKVFTISGTIQKSPFSPEIVDFTYSTEEFKKDSMKIINDKYYSDVELEDIKTKILAGQINLADLENPIIFNLLNFKKEEIASLKSNYKNFEILLSLNYINQKEVQKLIKDNNFLLELDTIELLYKKRFIDEKAIYDLYFKGNITLDKMKTIVNEEKYKVDVNTDDLLNYYSDAHQNPEDEEKLDKVKKYGKLVKEIKSENAKKQKEFYDEVVENLYLYYDELDLEELYDLDVLPIQTLIDWDGEERIYKLVENLKLKTEDVSMLIKEDKINIQKMGNSLVKSKASKLEKIKYICDSFSYSCNTQQETEERDRIADSLNDYIEMADFIKEIDENDTTGHGGGRKPVNPVHKKRKCYVSDVLSRWNLFKELDNNCTTEIYADGTTRFDLPNVNGGTVVFEKTLKSQKNQMVPDYAKATYIMSYAEFFKNKSQIEQQVAMSQNGQSTGNIIGINRKTLIDLYESGNADKIIHSPAWGTRIKQMLGAPIISAYGKTKEDRIDSLIKKIEKSRTLMD